MSNNINDSFPSFRFIDSMPSVIKPMNEQIEKPVNQASGVASVVGEKFIGIHDEAEIRHDLQASIVTSVVANVVTSVVGEKFVGIRDEAEIRDAEWKEFASKCPWLNIEGKKGSWEQACKEAFESYRKAVLISSTAPQEIKDLAGSKCSLNMHEMERLKNWKEAKDAIMVWVNLSSQCCRIDRSDILVSLQGKDEDAWIRKAQEFSSWFQDNFEGLKSSRLLRLLNLKLTSLPEELQKLPLQKLNLEGNPFQFLPEWTQKRLPNQPVVEKQLSNQGDVDWCAKEAKRLQDAPAWKEFAARCPWLNIQTRDMSYQGECRDVFSLYATNIIQKLPYVPSDIQKLAEAISSYNAVSIKEMETLKNWKEARDTLVVWNGLLSKKSFVDLSSLEKGNDWIEEAKKFALWMNACGEESLQDEKILSLTDLQLTSIPEELKVLKNLKELELTRNWLVTLPAWIKDLEQLQVLDVGQNKLTSLSPEIGKLLNLQILRLRKNPIAALPKEIGKLSQLVVLYAEENKLSYVPSELANLSNLKVLRLADNVANNGWIDLGNLAAALPALRKLQYLGLTGNRIHRATLSIGFKTCHESLVIHYEDKDLFPEYLRDDEEGCKSFLNELSWQHVKKETSWYEVCKKACNRRQRCIMDLIKAVHPSFRCEFPFILQNPEVPVEIRKLITRPSITLEDMKKLEKWKEARDTLVVWNVLSNYCFYKTAVDFSSLKTAADWLEKASTFSSWFKSNQEKIISKKYIRLNAKTLTSLPEELKACASLLQLQLDFNRETPQQLLAPRRPPSSV